MLHNDLRDDPEVRQACVPTALAAVTGVPFSRWVQTGRAIGGERVFRTRGVTTWEMQEMATRLGYDTLDILKRDQYDNPVSLQEALAQVRPYGPCVLLVRWGQWGHAIAVEDFMVYDTHVEQPTWFADWQYRYTTLRRWHAKRGGQVRVCHAFLIQKNPLTTTSGSATVSQ